MELQPISTLPLEAQVTMAYIEQALPDWQQARAKRDRAGGNSAEANLQFKDAAAHMDRLLEDLFAQNVQVEGHV